MKIACEYKNVDSTNVCVVLRKLMNTRTINVVLDRNYMLLRPEGCININMYCLFAQHFEKQCLSTVKKKSIEMKMVISLHK